MKKIRVYCIALAFLLILICSASALALNRYLRVGFNANLPPFQFLDASGKSAGMHIDMLEDIGEQQNYQFEFYPYESNTECLEALENGEIDLMLGAIDGSIEAEYAVAYTDALTSSQLCMIVENVPSANDAPPPITVAIFASDTVRHMLLANLGIHEFIAVGNQQMVYESHKRHPGSAMIGVKDSLLYQIAADGVDEHYAVRYNYLDTIEFAIVTRESDAELLRAMDESIARFKAGSKYESIRNKWLPVVDHEARLQRVFRMVMIASVIVVAVVFAYSMIMRRIQQVLKRRVKEQTEQIQRANEELEKQFVQIKDENDLRNRIIKYSPSGMLLFDREYKIILMNKSACAIAGLSEAPVGGSAMDVPVFRDILLREKESVFIEGMTVENGGIRIGDSPGSMRSYNYTIHQVIRYGSVAGILLSTQDMTKVERMQQAEFEKDKSLALTRIAAGLAHEIRNPLMSIRTFASLIGSKGDDKAVQESFARYVPDEVDRINRLIENLICYARPAKRHPERMSVAQIVEDSLALVKPVLRKSKFQLVQQLSAGLYIFADRDQIKQVLVNVLLNGVEAMEQKRRQGNDAPLTMEVKAFEDGIKVAVTVRDEGVGITAEELRVCKDPFFSTKERGTGLGLALCEQYIKENNGELQIDSVKDEFTIITLSFERSETDATTDSDT